MTSRYMARDGRPKFYFLTLSKLFCVVLLGYAFGACVEKEKVKTERPNQDIDWPQKEATPRKRGSLEGAETPARLLVVNSLSEDFSIARLAPEIKISKNVQMIPQDREDRFPCKAPNDIDMTDSLIYVTCSLSNEIHVFERGSLKLLRIFALPARSNPFSSVVYEKYLLVSSFLGDKIYVLLNDSGPIENRLVRSVDLSKLKLEVDPGAETRAYPEGLSVFRGKLFVSVTNLQQTILGNKIAGGPGYVAIYDLPSFELIRLVDTGGRNTVSTYLSEKLNSVFAVNSGDYDEFKGFVGNGSISQIDLDSLEVVSVNTVSGAPFEMVLSEKDIIYTSNGKSSELLRYDLASGRELGSVDLSRFDCGTKTPGDMSFISSLLRDRSTLYLTEFNSDCLIVYDLETGEVKSQWGVGDGPDAMAFF